MWDEETNMKIIKNAADQYHPAYDDTAWAKMQQLLDENLPRKKDRRRTIWFLPLVFLLAGIIFFVIFHNETISSLKISEKSKLKTDPESQDKQQNISAGKVGAKPNPVKPGYYAVADGNKRNGLSKEPSLNALNPGTKSIDKLSTLGNVNVVKRNIPLTSKNVPNNKGKQPGERPLSFEVNSEANSNKGNRENESINQGGKPSNEEIVSPARVSNDNPIEKVNTNITSGKKEIIKSKDKDIAKVENPKDANTGINQKKPKKGFTQNFGIGLSIAPDVSAVSLGNAGKITLEVGGDLSYSLTGRFTLRTGFYVATKIYSAEEDEYHIPPGYAGNYDYLQSVSANCKVYEIPLTLSYNFRKVKNHNWFASAGLSSYFMKRESYVYFYKYPWGVTTNKSWTVTNQNKHYFSVVDISAGYEHSFNKRFSIIAEPYVKLPLSGIGIGKIKLKSAGVLFTAAIKPFLK